MKTRQFFSLLRFSAGINPFILVFPLVFAFPLLFTHQFDGLYHPSLDLLLSVQNLFLVGMVGLWSLAPEMAQTRLYRASAAFSATEFLLTRAIDRACLYRARTALLFLLVLVFPVVAILHALPSPDLLISEYSKTVQAACLHAVPGAYTQPDPKYHRDLLIFLPRGNILVNEWQLWYFVSALVMTQVLLSAIAPLKFRLFIFYAVFFTGIMAPLFFNIRHIGSHEVTPEESVFFLFAAHPLLFWIGSALAWILGQLICEMRFRPAGILTDFAVENRDTNSTRRRYGLRSGMTERSSDQLRAQWLLAGRLTGVLSVAQMLIFTVLMVRLHSVALASVDFWLLILGFSISGVCATVCLSRTQTQGS